TRALATTHVRFSFYLGGAWLAAGDLRRALPAFLVATEARPDEPVAWYNLACVEARLGRLDDALASLEKSLAAGFSAGAQMRSDPDLAALAGDPRFARLLARAGAAAPPG
ncbi:MAG: tetratricopeptide repeat protein, partial [Thermoanaerobaculia bacterium]|nr:tetratricopeptide repeat protein [Thermoanaerobaculia bacterium]